MAGRVKLDVLCVVFGVGDGFYVWGSEFEYRLGHESDLHRAPSCPSMFLRPWLDLDVQAKDKDKKASWSSCRRRWRRHGRREGE